MADSPADLQFERAEPTGAALPKDVRGVACRTPLSSYFEVNGNVACDNCKDTAMTRQNASHAPALLRGAALGGEVAIDQPDIGSGRCERR